MSKLGEWIDGLSDTEKDRIVRATEWCHGVPYYGRRCLVGHVMDTDHTIEMLEVHGSTGSCMYHGSLMHRFDRLVGRFGLDRIVRACKARAAATMSSEVERAEEAVHG